MEVFELLEALYGEFDKIAKRRHVFKVETVSIKDEQQYKSAFKIYLIFSLVLFFLSLLKIGDCYVAVTGIPEPQKNHAPIMVRFARDCMVKMNQTLRELVDSLGEDTMVCFVLYFCVSRYTVCASRMFSPSFILTFFLFFYRT